MIRKLEENLDYFLLAPALVVLSVFVLFPVIRTVWLSFHQVFLSMPGLGNVFVGLDNYRLLLRDPSFLTSYGITLFFVVVATAFELLFGLILALVIHRAFPARGAVRAVVLIPWALPAVVASQMWRFIFNDQYGFFNLILYGEQTSAYKPWLADPDTALIAILAADIWKTSSFAGLLILAGLQIIPETLYRAARVDGATAWQQFRSITLPLIKPALVVALLFRTMDAFRVFDLVFVMTQGGPADSTQVLQFFGYQKIFAEGDLGYGCAVSTIIFLTTLTLSLFYIKTVGLRLLEREESP